MNNKFSKETLCVQAGWTPKKGEPRVLPIYQSTTFKYDTSEQMARLFDLEDSGYFYTRLQNPTNDAVASKIAALEGGVGAMLTSSGQAANFYAVFNICEAALNVHSWMQMHRRKKSARLSVPIRNVCSAKQSPIRASMCSTLKSLHVLPTNMVCLSS